MELNTFIEVQEFGDFDVKYTNCIMVHSDKMDKNEILNEFYQVQGIEGFDSLAHFLYLLLYLVSKILYR